MEEDGKKKVVQLVSTGSPQAETHPGIIEAVDSLKDDILVNHTIVSFAGVCITDKGEAYLGVVGEDGMLQMLGALDMVKQQILDEVV